MRQHKIKYSLNTIVISAFRFISRIRYATKLKDPVSRNKNYLSIPVNGHHKTSCRTTNRNSFQN